ncbi:hypothetical protein DFH08DRAFT_818161 [Mycena albidolilacea]|uniref:Uncharacterized protein n=1 Tax=Mycena albidolilacea TaxID=1033008 RepID=A0AAD7EI37_9AGAR|nr:hypothetical protein DFH08DRAFT_818161 [Mycena albidolilacea]
MYPTGKEQPMSQKPCSACKGLIWLETLKRPEGDYKPLMERLTIHCRGWLVRAFHSSLDVLDAEGSHAEFIVIPEYINIVNHREELSQCLTRNCGNGSKCDLQHSVTLFQNAPSCQHLWGSVGPSPTSARCGAEWSSTYIRDGQDAIEDAAPKQSNEHTVASHLIFISGFINCLRLLLTQLLIGSCSTLMQSTTMDQMVTVTGVPLELLHRVVVLAPSPCQEKEVC